MNYILLRLKKIWFSIFNRKSLVKIDDVVFYDRVRDKILIKRPFKRTIVLDDRFRKNHFTVHVGKNEYKFFCDSVIINNKVVYF